MHMLACMDGHHREESDDAAANVACRLCLGYLPANCACRKPFYPPLANISKLSKCPHEESANDDIGCGFDAHVGMNGWLHREELDDIAGDAACRPCLGNLLNPTMGSLATLPRLPFGQLVGCLANEDVLQLHLFWGYLPDGEN